MSAHRSLAALLIVSLAALSLPACSVKYGREPDTELLTSSLHQRMSTKEDVLNVLGPPAGYGRADLGPPSELQVLWFYEYAEGSLTGFRFKMLVVFFEQEVYTGHLWFSSQGRLEKATPAGEKAR